jgi:uncharacterized protein YjlB
MPASAIVHVPARMHLFGDDGTFPNSRFPVLVYPAAVVVRSGGVGLRPLAPGAPTRSAWHSHAALADVDPAAAFEALFDANGWGGASWRNGLFQVHHYHSTAHEVLGVYSGKVRIQLGGPTGTAVDVHAGDVVVIPAGVAHKSLGASADFRVVGAYPAGTSPDLNYGKRGERPDTDRNIARLAVPAADPVEGKGGTLVAQWSPKR